MKLFAVVCPVFGAKFAFEAKDAAEAGDLIFAWNSYHGFRGRDLEHTVAEIDESDLGKLRISVHNEYVSFLLG